jgi:16S rRNA (cytosine1402-N4)-methyltransferase
MAGDNTYPGSDPGISTKVVGGPEGHIPVMLNEVLVALQPAPGKLIVDGTFGAGGYGSAILAKGANLLAIDRDPDALAAAETFAQEFGDRFQFQSGEFGQMDILSDEAGCGKVDGVVLDIGVSSMQIDQADRGFSFLRDGPLDMRMGQSGLSASDIINRAEGKDLTRIIGILGEERHAGRVSRAIVAAREDKPILRTLELAALVEKTLGRKFSDKIHPATRTFQALRIFVNRELEQLANGLFAAERILKSGGRLVVVTFHSLEDRIVKQFFADRCGGASGSRHLPQTEKIEPRFSQQKRNAIKASDEETAINARARSAKLRWAIRTDAEPGAADLGLFGREVALSLSGPLSGSFSSSQSGSNSAPGRN